jgi:dihydrolipoamide dehydrogenase
VDTFDLVIIGSGPAGYVAAIRAAQLGGKVAVVEKELLGGTCLNWGCIPTKALLASAYALDLVRRAGDYGVKVEGVSFDLAAIMQRKTKVVDRMRRGIDYLFRKREIDLVKGHGSLAAPDLVEVRGEGGELIRRLKGSRVIVATGSRALTPPLFAADGEKVLTSTELLNVSEVPPRLVIVGAGPVGCEFACVFRELGTQVTIVEMLPRILPTEDEELSELLRGILSKRGVSIKTGTRVREVTKSAQGVTLRTEAGDEIPAEKVLVGIGRSLNSEGIGLERVGVQIERGRISVDEHMETNVRGVHAAGDVTGKYLLAHAAEEQGIVAAENAMGNGGSSIDYRAVPACIFTFPEMASVGLSETKAREQGFETKVGRFFFIGNGKAWAMGETQGLVKVVADARTDEVLGVHILGPEATDLIPEATLAVKYRMKARDVGHTIHAHPTLSEALWEAFRDVNKNAIHVV